MLTEHYTNHAKDTDYQQFRVGREVYICEDALEFKSENKISKC